MNIIVCVKQVPDPNSVGQLDPASNTLKREGVEVVLDPGDEYGIEAALQLADAHGGQVTVISMGPEKALDAIRKALAMGAAKGILISDDGLKGADALTTAKVLASAIKREPDWQLIITATESTDGYTGVVPQMLAELLGVPSVTFAKSIESDGTTLNINRQTEAGYDVVEADLPAVLSVTAGVNEPRYPSLKGIMAAKSKPVDRPSLADLGVSGGAGQQITGVQPAEQRAAGEVVEDDGTGAQRVVDFLAAQKVI